jgi:ribonucleases P/MRP protein subunit RPP40
MRFLSDNVAITRSQHGFRKGRSCESQLALLNHDIMRAADEGFRTDAIFLDFKKAFDTVPHEKLIKKLESYSIDDQIIQWIKSFLTGRSQRVVLDGVCSDELEVSSGVPQGSVIGPILFLIYINDIVDNVKSNVRLFADDTLIYRKILSTEDISILQGDLDVISKWCKDWQLGLNVGKCVAMSMTRSLFQSSSQTPYHISGRTLDFVSQYKYLGVTFSSNFSFKSHIRDVVGSADRTLRLCTRVLRGSQSNVKEVAYFSLVRPLLEYCCAVWNPHEKGLILELERVQRRAARFVKGDFRFDSSVSDMIKSLGWESLEDRRTDYRRRLFEKFLGSDLHDEIRDIVIPVLSERDLRDQASKKFREIIARTDSYYWSVFPDSIRSANLTAN